GDEPRHGTRPGQPEVGVVPTLGQLLVRFGEREQVGGGLLTEPDVQPPGERGEVDDRHVQVLAQPAHSARVGTVGYPQRAVVGEQPALHGGGQHRLPTAFAHLRHERGQVLAVPAVGGQLVAFLVVVPELDQHMVPGRDRVQGGLPAALGYERVGGGTTDRPVRDLVGDELVEHAAPPDHTGTV